MKITYWAFKFSTCLPPALEKHTPRFLSLPCEGHMKAEGGGGNYEVFPTCLQTSRLCYTCAQRSYRNCINFMFLCLRVTSHYFKVVTLALLHLPFSDVHLTFCIKGHLRKGFTLSILVLSCYLWELQSLLLFSLTSPLLNFTITAILILCFTSTDG